MKRSQGNGNRRRSHCLLWLHDIQVDTVQLQISVLKEDRVKSIYLDALPILAVFPLVLLDVSSGCFIRKRGCNCIPLAVRSSRSFCSGSNPDMVISVHTVLLGNMVHPRSLVGRSVTRAIGLSKAKSSCQLPFSVVLDPLFSTLNNELEKSRSTERCNYTSEP